MAADRIEAGAGIAGLAAGGAGLLASVLDGGAVAEWIERVGLPAALLLGLIYLLIRAARYVTSTVIEPMTARHMTFVGKVETAVQESAEANKRTAALVAELKDEAREDRRTTRIGFDRLRSAILANGCAYPGSGRNGKVDPERTTTIQEDDDGEHDA